MSYPEAIKYLEALINYEKLSSYSYSQSIKLERIKGFLDLIDNPQNYLKCIHIAGSKGKGSTCAFIAYILREAGFRVGLYTSPHLCDFRERIRILKPGENRSKGLNEFEGMIPRLRLSGLVSRYKSTIDKYNRASIYGPLSFFEVYTALAFVYFKEGKVDFAVLETGLGGRLDATNVASALVCVITPISYEHTDKLGDTLKEIAREKAGIIKNNSIVISAPQEPEALKVIRKKCIQTGSRLELVDRYKNQKIKLIGKHQLINAAVARCAIKSFGAYNINVDANEIKLGLSKTLWPGRCEVVSKSPLVILDGAQNIASCGVLVKAIRDNFKYSRLLLVFGVSNDKDVLGMCGELYGLADLVILTRSSNPRATEPAILSEHFKNKEKYITSSINQAKLLARGLAHKDDLILVTGSLFVVGEFRDDKKRFN
ncbi:MAG: bifunctional folylpolyglutamate synthase/dihydrofolate synthase [Candidatus Omnitrophica bacterium]|nr:bifunctional folylpolyglutamate synthase/dihydrofolate synthase [Candidatus Omnitrophota bacterium]